MSDLGLTPPRLPVNSRTHTAARSALCLDTDQRPPSVTDQHLHL